MVPHIACDGGGTEHLVLEQFVGCPHPHPAIPVYTLICLAFLCFNFYNRRMNQKPRFPDDWIMPGEFSFCGTCGKKNTLVLMVSAIRPHCPFCSHHSSNAQKRQERRSKIADKIRIDLAMKRMTQGQSPLFWMNPHHRKIYTFAYWIEYWKLKFLSWLGY